MYIYLNIYPYTYTDIQAFRNKHIRIRTSDVINMLYILSKILRGNKYTPEKSDQRVDEENFKSENRDEKDEGEKKRGEAEVKKKVKDASANRKEKRR